MGAALEAEVTAEPEALVTRVEAGAEAETLEATELAAVELGAAEEAGARASTLLTMKSDAASV